VCSASTVSQHVLLDVFTLGVSKRPGRLKAALVECSLVHVDPLSPQLTYWFALLPQKPFFMAFLSCTQDKNPNPVPQPALPHSLSLLASLLLTPCASLPALHPQRSAVIASYQAQLTAEAQGGDEAQPAANKGSSSRQPGDRAAAAGGGGGGSRMATPRHAHRSVLHLYRLAAAVGQLSVLAFFHIPTSPFVEFVEILVNLLLSVTHTG